ncbi:MAG: hypothetical protein ACLP9L_24635 [Thermoguttaceae bacterium]
MPRMSWTVLLGALLLWAQLAMAGEPLSLACDCPCRAKCRAAPIYALAPGCCEAHRHCFDNAWDGYCQERARWDTFWCKVGTGAFYPCTCCATRAGRGAAFEVCPPPAAAACGCQGPGAAIPTARQ